MNFAVFSDYPCRVRYVDSIRLPIDLAPVTIEPASNGQWVVVEQWNEGESSLKLFLREGEGISREPVAQSPSASERADNAARSEIAPEE